jgi:tripartite-type tricarboxylate transporter receptor subunit TctC
MKTTQTVSTLFAALVVSAAGFVNAEDASAQNYPVRPITLMVGYPAGGSVDGTARRYADLLSKSVGQPVVVDNRSNQLVATGNVKNAVPDGYTLLIVAAGPNTVLPAMQTVDFDPLKDFTYITKLAISPIFLAVPTSSPAHSVKELLEWARKKPGGLNYGIPGIGSASHFSGAIFERDGKAPMTMIPYGSVPQTVLELSAGRLDWIAANHGGPALAARDGGQLRYLAVFEHKRSRLAPDLPSMDEEGFPQTVQSVFWGVAGPRGLPRAIVANLYDEFTKASKAPELAKALNPLGLDVVVSTSPEDFTREIAREVEEGAKLVKDLGIKMQ